MDAHVFRRIGEALRPLLQGARLEKIHSPAENIFVFTVYTAHKRKEYLILRAERRTPFLYFASQRPAADGDPSALIMRWRKHCCGKRIVSCVIDWTERRLLLLFRSAAPMTLPTTAVETWLIIDLRTGPQLILGACPLATCTNNENVCWPAPMLIEDACTNWRQWPVLTPALRRTLSHMDILDQQALLADLEVGGGDIFVYTHTNTPDNLNLAVHNDTQAELWAWPLPTAQAKERQEHIFEAPLDAAAFVGDAIVLGQAFEKKRHAAATPHQRHIAKLERLLAKLHTEEQRLQAMAEKHQQGCLLQAILWRFSPDTKCASVNTDDPQCPVLQLNARLTVRENMQSFFHQAGRGQRGLTFLYERRAALEQSLAQAKATAHIVEAGADIAPTKQQKNTISQMQLPRGVQLFRSSDGFILLRGKDAKGNTAALRAAAPHDLWLHVEGGPGSHVIIRRQFLGQDIPENTLHQAANLAAVKSWQRENLTANILCAEVRHVKAMRGTATGTVRIDKVFTTFCVTVDTAIERLLEVTKC